MANNKKSVPDPQRIYQLAESYLEASRLLTEQAKGEQWSCSAPQLLVDSFAVELYLKCLFVLDKTAEPPREHDWQALFDALNLGTQSAIRYQFKQIVDSHSVLSNLAELNPEALKVRNFERSFTAAKDTFEKRRYLYESVGQTEWFYAHLIRDAIRAVINKDPRIRQSRTT